MYNIKFIKDSDGAFAEVKKIRTAVFTKEQGADSEGEFDRYDEKAEFALMYDEKNAVATARVVLTNSGYKIGRIAVLKAYRGKGLGNSIVRAVTERAFENGAERVLVDAQNYAVPFYEKIGFKITGSEITDRGLPHIPMTLEKGEYYGKEEKE